MSRSAAATRVLEPQQRRSRLVMHLAHVVQRGGSVEQHEGVRAIVLMRVRAPLAPEACVVAAGIVLWFLGGGAACLVASMLGALGWHHATRSHIAGRRVLVRVDDDGRLSEVELSKP